MGYVQSTELQQMSNCDCFFLFISLILISVVFPDMGRRMVREALRGAVKAAFL